MILYRCVLELHIREHIGDLISQACDEQGHVSTLEGLSYFHEVRVSRYLDAPRVYVISEGEAERFV